MVTLLLTVDEAELVELALRMVPRAAVLLARLEHLRRAEARLPWPEPPRLLVVEKRDGTEVVCEYYQNEQVDRILAAIDGALHPPRKTATRRPLPPRRPPRRRARRRVP